MPSRLYALFVLLALCAGCDLFGGSLERDRFEGTLRYTDSAGETEVYDLDGAITFEVLRRPDGTVDRTGGTISTGLTGLVSLLSFGANGDLLTRTGTFDIGPDDSEVQLINLCDGCGLLLTFDGTLHVRSFGDEIEGSFEARSGGSGIPLYEIEGSFRATVEEESRSF